MTAFLTSKALLSSRVRSANIEPNDSHSTHVLGVFSDSRDAKVALEELRDAGFPSKWITLFARDFQRYSWSPNLAIHNCFNEETFNFDHIAQDFFRRFFRRGKYLVLVRGNDNDINSAGKIMARRRNHAKVWNLKKLQAKS